MIWCGVGSYFYVNIWKMIGSFKMSFLRLIQVEIVALSTSRRESAHINVAIDKRLRAALCVKIFFTCVPMFLLQP